MRIAKADLVPTEANLLDAVRHLRRARPRPAEMLCEQVNARPHRATGRVPAEVLAEERRGCMCCPRSRSPSRSGRPGGWAGTATISVDGVRYSVPHQHVDERVWVRWSGEELVVTVVDAGPARSRSPGTGAGSAGRPADPRRALPGRPSRPPRACPGTGPHAPPTRPRRRSWPSATARQSWLVEAAAAGDGPGAVEDGRSGRVRQAARHRRGRPGAGHRGAGRPVRRRRPRLRSWPTSSDGPSRRRRDPGERGPQPATRHRRAGPASAPPRRRVGR